MGKTNFSIESLVGISSKPKHEQLAKDPKPKGELACQKKAVSNAAVISSSLKPLSTVATTAEVNNGTGLTSMTASLSVNRCSTANKQNNRQTETIVVDCPNCGDSDGTPPQTELPLALDGSDPEPCSSPRGGSKSPASTPTPNIVTDSGNNNNPKSGVLSGSCSGSTADLLPFSWIGLAAGAAGHNPFLVTTPHLYYPSGNANASAALMTKAALESALIGHPQWSPALAEACFQQSLVMSSRFLPNGEPLAQHYSFGTGFRKAKRIRTAFNPGQLIALENAFEKNHYVVGNERKELAKSLKLSETQVKVWFQNRRTKHKRMLTEGDSPNTSTKHSGGSGPAPSKKDRSTTVSTGGDTLPVSERKDHHFEEDEEEFETDIDEERENIEDDDLGIEEGTSSNAALNLSGEEIMNYNTSYGGRAGSDLIEEHSLGHEGLRREGKHSPITAGAS